MENISKSTHLVQPIQRLAPNFRARVEATFSTDRSASAGQNFLRKLLPFVNRFNVKWDLQLKRRDILQSNDKTRQSNFKSQNIPIRSLLNERYHCPYRTQYPCHSKNLFSSINKPGPERWSFSTTYNLTSATR